MDINQSTQIFLLYVAICLVILIGLFFLFKQNKQEKLSLIGAVQTSILVVGFLSLIVFGGSYYFVLSDVEPSKQPLKDALSIAAGFFGGFATLTAAYIASRLFNDWRVQHNKQIKDQYFVEILKIMRVDLISLAPTLNQLIVACEKYTNKDEVIELRYSSEELEAIYLSHKTVSLLFKEYYYTFNDDKTYLVYLKFYHLMENLISILIKTNKINSTSDKLEDLTRQLYIISYPIELINGIEKTTKADEILPVDMCRYVEHYYFNLVKQIASLKLAK